MSDIPSQLLPVAIGVPVLAPNSSSGQINNDTPVVLQESDLADPMMWVYEGYLRHIYSLPNAHPDALIAHRGYDFLDEILTMSAYSTPLRMLMYACLYKGWELLPAVASVKTEQKDGGSKGDYDEAMRQLEQAYYMLNNIRNPETDTSVDFREVLWTILQGIHNGFSAQEIIYRVIPDGPYKNLWGFQDFVYHQNKSVGFDLNPDTFGIMNIRCWSPTVTKPMTAAGKVKRPGRRVPIEKCLMYTFDKRNALPYGYGVARTSYKHYLSVEQGLRDWKITAERAGGWLEGQVDDPKAQMKLAAKMTAVQNGAVLVRTSQETITVHPAQGGSADFLQNFILWHCAQIKECILGQTLTTTQSAKGSYAQATVHSQTQNFFIARPRNDMEFICDNQLLRRLSRYNNGVEKQHLHPKLFLGHWDIEENLLLAQQYDIWIKNGTLIQEYDNDKIRSKAKLFALDMSERLDLPIPPDPGTAKPINLKDDGEND